MDTDLLLTQAHNCLTVMSCMLVNAKDIRIFIHGFRQYVQFSILTRISRLYVPVCHLPTTSRNCLQNGTLPTGLCISRQTMHRWYHYINMHCVLCFHRITKVLVFQYSRLLQTIALFVLVMQAVSPRWPVMPDSSSILMTRSLCTTHSRNCL